MQIVKGCKPYKSAKKEEIEDLKEIFNYLDENANGRLSQNEFKTFLKSEDVVMSKEEIQLLVCFN